jgi:hypothetical protein
MRCSVITLDILKYFFLKQEENQYKLIHFYPVTAIVKSLSTSAAGAASFSPKTDTTALFRAAFTFSLFFATFSALSAFRLSFRPFCIFEISWVGTWMRPSLVPKASSSPSSRRAHF